MPNLLTDNSSFENSIKNSGLTVVHFCADWAEQCTQINDVLDALAKQSEYSEAKFCKCQAEDLSEISLKYKIEAVPTIILFRSSKVIDRVDGADAAKLTAKVKQHCQNTTTDVPQNGDNKVPQSLEEKLKGLINRHNVMLFMKGDRNNPRCGFSKQTIHILNEIGVEYGTFDILTDEDVRQGLKVFSEWPTYPQLYVKGELIGGLDIIKEMQAAGELLATLKD